MSNASNDMGRAYEYAWINVLYNRLINFKKVNIIDNSSFLANKKSWNLVSDEQKNLFKISAEAAVDLILELEPIMIEISDDCITLEFQADSSGVSGDVRDIVIKRQDIAWEIGLSVKHNHEAIKHSRLANRLDFGNKWFGIPCSKNYWDNVQPIFKMLGKEKNKGTKWADIVNKDLIVYLPLLNAFIDEVKHAYSIDSQVPRKMVEYLIGTYDYYKVVSIDSKKMTLVHSFNMHNTLNQPSSSKSSSIVVPTVELPTEIIDLRIKPNSTNTVEMYLNNGWQISFRIHSASTDVEQSLKFDIQFMGMPISILTIECKWQ